ncbi:lipase member M-like [Nothoprocta perdicaria]|uniref:lipase member M-like n=1 Tax=Nothoprocta perdicaria TaxID=30464 RepID=UPI000E1BC263|nr:lipase member M-like [Nothoprocta perdicaria]
MWCLLMLLSFQAIAPSAGFSSALNSEEIQKRKSRNPECFMNVSEIIRYHGYPSEEHEVTTEDGYILRVFRIPGGRNSPNTGRKPVVFIHHGTVGDSIHWITNLPNNSLGFILADAGYDVWIGNSRGNTWSLKHKTLKPCQRAFWKFSFHEIGKYDLPAELYFTMNKTGQKQLYYIGHSEASTAAFIAFSTYPELAQRIKVFFALGPVATLTYAYSPLTAFLRLPQSFIRLTLGYKGAFHQNELLKRPLTLICKSFPKTCASVLAYIAGGRIQNLNMSRIDVYVAHYPAGTSVQNLIHWHQLIHANRFQAYDYGTKENMKKYNQAIPPAYEIEKINTPIALWSGGLDKFAHPKDLARLLPRIKKLIYYDNFPEWGHLDFIWGLDATKKMYWKITELIRKNP